MIVGQNFPLRLAFRPAGLRPSVQVSRGLNSARAFLRLLRHQRASGHIEIDAPQNYAYDTHRRRI
jgi:hypothetical protein